MKKKFTVLIDDSEQSWPSQAAAERHFGLRQGTIKDRLGLGWTNRQAVQLDDPPTPEPPPNATEWTINVEGVDLKFIGYKSLEDRFGIKKDTIRGRVDRGWPIEAAVQLVDRPKRPPPPHTCILTVEGLTFFGYAALGDHYGLSGDTIRQKVNNGHSLESAVGLAPPENKRAVSVKDGDTIKYFKSIASACEAYNKNYNTVYDRHMRAGWTLEQSLDLETHPKHTTRSFGLVYLLTHRTSGKKYIGQTVTTLERRWTGHCSDAGRSPSASESLVAKLIREDGADAFEKEVIGTAGNQHDLDDLEQQLIRKHNTLAPNGLNKSAGGGGSPASSGIAVAVNGVDYPSIAAAARQYGIHPDTFRQRLKKGLSPEAAAQVSDLGFRSTKAKPVNFTYRKKRYYYASRGKAASAWGLSRTCLEYRLDKLRWSARKACTTPADSNAQNKKRVRFIHKKKLYTYGSRSEAAKAWKIPYRIAKSRYRRGWDDRRVYTTPIQKRNTDRFRSPNG